MKPTSLLCPLRVYDPDSAAPSAFASHTLGFSNPGSVLSVCPPHSCPGYLPLLCPLPGTSAPGSSSESILTYHLPRGQTSPSKLGPLPAICPRWEPCLFPWRYRAQFVTGLFIWVNGLVGFSPAEGNRAGTGSVPQGGCREQHLHGPKAAYLQGSSGHSQGSRGSGWVPVCPERREPC